MDEGEKESTLPAVGSSDLDVSPDTGVRTKQDQLLLSDVPKLIAEGGNLMAKQFLVATILGSALAFSVPVVQAEIDKDPVVVQQNYESDEPASLIDKAKERGLSLWSGAKERFVKLTSDDARLEEAMKRNAALQDKIAELQKQLDRNDIEVGINHRIVMECVKDAYNYLESQLPQPTEVK